MTGIRQQSARPGARADAQGVAVACLGMLLLAGTALPGLTQSGPVLPITRVACPAQASRDGNLGDPRQPSEGREVWTLEAVRTPDEHPAVAPPLGLDINRADALALQTLAGVGPALARRIVAHRESHGPFRTPEDLLHVPGIGVQRYERLRGLIRTVETP